MDPVDSVEPEAGPSQEPVDQGAGQEPAQEPLPELNLDDLLDSPMPGAPDSGVSNTFNHKL